MDCPLCKNSHDRFLHIEIEKKFDAVEHCLEGICPDVEQYIQLSLCLRRAQQYLSDLKGECFRYEYEAKGFDAVSCAERKAVKQRMVKYLKEVAQSKEEPSESFVERCKKVEEKDQLSCEVVGNDIVHLCYMTPQFRMMYLGREPDCFRHLKRVYDSLYDLKTIEWKEIGVGELIDSAFELLDEILGYSNWLLAERENLKMKHLASTKAYDSLILLANELNDAIFQLRLNYCEGKFSELKISDDGECDESSSLSSSGECGS